MDKTSRFVQNSFSDSHNAVLVESCFLENRLNLSKNVTSPNRFTPTRLDDFSTFFCSHLFVTLLHDISRSLLIGNGSFTEYCCFVTVIFVFTHRNHHGIFLFFEWSLSDGVRGRKCAT